MKGEDVLRIAKENGIVVAGNFPSSTGVAVLGELSEKERQALQLQVSATLSAEISYRHPAKIRKSADSKSVDVECTVFVFNANQLISLVDKCFTESYTAKIDEKIRAGAG